MVRAPAGVSVGAAAIAAREVLDLDPAVDGVFATLDRLALATLVEVQSRGLGVPGDVLIAGATDSEAARWSNPPLTVLNLHPDRIGASAAELLLALCRGDLPADPQALVPFELVERASTRSRHGEPLVATP